MKELWKDVPGYEGHYQVSDQGRVRSLKSGEGKIMKITVDSAGCNRVHLSMKKKSKVMRPHKLVAMAFLGHKPQEDGLVVYHKELPKTDDRLSNLRLSKLVLAERSNRYAGVYWRKDMNKWGTKIYNKGKVIYLGAYSTELEAHDVCQQARKGLGC